MLSRCLSLGPGHLAPSSARRHVAWSTAKWRRLVSTAPPPAPCPTCRHAQSKASPVESSSPRRAYRLPCAARLPCRANGSPACGFSMPGPKPPLLPGSAITTPAGGCAPPSDRGAYSSTSIAPPVGCRTLSGTPSTFGPRSPAAAAPVPPATPARVPPVLSLGRTVAGAPHVGRAAGRPLPIDRLRIPAASPGAALCPWLCLLLVDDAVLLRVDEAARSWPPPPASPVAVAASPEERRRAKDGAVIAALLPPLLRRPCSGAGAAVTSAGAPLCSTRWSADARASPR